MTERFIKRTVVFLQCAVITLFSFLAISAAGEIDPTFNVAVQETTQSPDSFSRGSVHAIVGQPDGKFVVGGNFNIAGNSARSSVARFNADGTVDPTFDPPDFYTYDANFLLNPEAVYIYAVAIQPDGKILVGGNFIIVGGQGYRGILRLDANGTLDTTFVVPILPSNSPVDSTIYKIQVLGNNQIMIGGQFTLISLQTGSPDRINLARLNANGSTDLSFSQVPTQNKVFSFVAQADGKVVYATNPTGILRRVNADGSADSSFTESNISGGGGSGGTPVKQIIVQPDGKIIIVGAFTSLGNFIARLTTSGELDPTFSANASGRLNDVAVASDGKIIVGGSFSLFNGVRRWCLALLNTDGSLFSSFENPPFQAGEVYAVAATGDGKFLVGGRDFLTPLLSLARLNADGSPDTTFVGEVYRKGTVFKTVVQPDGKILLAGIFGKINGIVRQGFARLNADGSLDPTFTANVGNIAQAGTTIVLQADGKIIVAGTFSTINGVLKPYLARLDNIGNMDAGFNVPLSSAASLIDEIVPLPDGKIIMGGNIRLASGEMRSVVRLNNNGSLDTTFNTVLGVPASTVVPIVRALKVQTDGKIMIGGQFQQVNGVTRGRIARLNADGSVDTTFNPSSGVNAEVVDLAVQSSGSVVIGGEFTSVNGNANIKYLARLLSDGSLDPNFVGTSASTVYAVEKAANDKILVSGIFSIVNSVRRFGVARLNPNGSLDNSFSGVALNDAALSLFIQSDNKLLIAGDFSRANGISKIGAARVNNAPGVTRTPFDFDGDGRADVSVFRPSNGFWYRLNSSNNSFNAVQFGQSTDKPAPADYDGDGKTDIAVFREGEFGYFYILDSSNNTFRYEQFGRTGDVPLPGDWDGDGKADVAVYRRPSTLSQPIFFFYRPTTQPSVSFNMIPFGGGGDKPVQGDFDGDGKLDAAFFRSSNSSWWILQSTNNQIINITFGASSDIPVAADYDGDGKTNIAVFRPSNGTWYTSQNPATNFGAIVFGQSGDVPVPADYDGDGRADAAVYRGGAWYLLGTQAGFTGVTFGAADDKPIPNAFVP